MAINGLWQSANGAGNILDCRRLSNRLQQLTADNENDDFLLQAHHSAWATALHGGEPAAARDHSDAGCQLYDPKRHRLHHQRYGGHDPGTCALYLGAQAHWMLGYPEKGLASGGDIGIGRAERSSVQFRDRVSVQRDAPPRSRRA